MNFSLKRLKWYCEAEKDDLVRHFKKVGGKKTRVRTIAGDYLVHVDNGADVLGVAHMDTVGVLYGPVTPKAMIKGNTLVSIALDDRLGVYVLAEVLPSNGIVMDWLFTDAEEMCLSTAEYFTTKKPYNWVVEFDRRGTRDVAMYQYLSQEWEEELPLYHMEAVRGSYSDICVLSHLRLTCFNWGVGFREPHTLSCHCTAPEVVSSLHRFTMFWRDYHDIFLPWEWEEDYYLSSIYHTRKPLGNLDPYLLAKDAEYEDLEKPWDYEDIDAVSAAEDFDPDEAPQLNDWFRPGGKSWFRSM